MALELSEVEQARFWAKVQRSDGCWLWVPNRRSRYGSFHLYRGGQRMRALLAHRVAWQLTHGSIPNELQVCHRCDVPRCVNPSHLFLGTQADNILDCMAKGRHNSQQSGVLKVSPEQIEIILSRASAGDQYTDIARDIGVSRTAVSGYARAKTARTAHVKPVPLRVGHKWTQRIDKAAVLRLRALGLSFHRIAAQLGIAPMSAWRILRDVEGARGAGLRRAS